ncbi:hypothetical protein SLEP1_g46622 [Rubroshorea leprosula]|uniref:glucan endo-1,3-beta-D-glucosidase n=1 Tax=Rubroshorea leprosula TaxID=152421 RepID=A0AAV5LNK1_9ROSI|nr:hypothetical protein SLEP1_g46622 [Rubroshorea leprosula]
MLCFPQDKSMASYGFPIFHFLLSTVLFSSIVDAAGLIGVNYGRVANDLPTPDKVVELLKTQGIDRVKLYDTDAEVLTALADSNISVVVALPNELLSSTAADQSFADNWYNLDSAIKISSPIALSALQSSYPPSSGSFNSQLIEPAVKPMLDFLRQSGSYLMVNAYPFFAYSDNSDSISLDYALFKNNSGVVDSGNGKKYYSLLEAQLDAVFAAMSALNYDDVKVVVTETGWPSKGDENEIGAGEENAASYNGNLVRRVLTGSGTPLRPQDPLNVYLFALFNENEKSGPTSERNYGLFYPNEQKVYSIPLTQSELQSGASTPVSSGNQSQAPASSNESKTSVAQTWCVANGKAGEKKLQEALDYACGSGRADCSPIQPGASCYDPNTLEAHASYAFNSYYQKNSRGAGTCDFGGSAYVVTQVPSTFPPFPVFN